MKKSNLFIAGVFAINAVAYSSSVFASSRVDQLAQQTINESQKNLSAVKAELLTLDGSLADLETKVSTARGTGSKILGGVSMTAAGAGLAMTAIAALASTQGRAGSGVATVIMWIGGTATTVIAAVGSLSDSALVDAVNTEELSEKLNQAAEASGKLSAQTSDPATAALIGSLNNKLKESRALIRSLQKAQTSDAKQKLITHLTQAAGIALSVYSMTQNSPKAGYVGAVLMSVGNLSNLLDGLSETDSEKVLAEIKATRVSIAQTASTL